MIPEQLPATDASTPVNRSRTRNYLAGLGTGYVVTFATIFVGLWLTPFTLRFLDREEYAVFALISDVLMWLGLLDLGVAAGLRVQAAQLSGKPDQERLNRLASTAFFTQSLIVLVILAVGGILAVTFPHFFPVRADLHDNASLVMGLLVVGSAMSIGSQTFSALLFAHQQVHVDNLIRLLLIVVRTALTVVLLKAGWELYALAVANLVATATTTALAVLRTYRLLPGLHLSRRLASWETLKSIGELGIWFSLGGLAGIIIMQMDRIVTAKVVSVEMVTTLTLTGRLYLLSNSLLDQITNNARPMLGQLLGEGKKAEAFQKYRYLFTFSTSLAVIAAASLWAANESFVTRWVGREHYGGMALDVALAFNLLLNCWVIPNRAVLAAGLVVRPQTLCRLLEGILNLLLSILLGKMLGLFGIIIATSIAGAVTSWWYLPFLTARMFERPFLRFWWEEASRICLLVAVLTPLAYVVRHHDSHWQGFLEAALRGGLTAACGMLLFWCLVMNRPMRMHVLAIVESGKRRY